MPDLPFLIPTDLMDDEESSETETLTPTWVILATDAADESILGEVSAGGAPFEAVRLQSPDEIHPLGSRLLSCAGLVLDLGAEALLADIMRWSAVAESANLPVIALSDDPAHPLRPSLADIGIERLLPRNASATHVLWTLRAVPRLALSAPWLVLVATPDPALGDRIQSDLADVGFRAECFSDLEAIGARAKGLCVDALLLDTALGADVASLVRSVRANPDFTLVPLLLLHPVEDPELRRRALSVGVDDWIGLPWIAREATHRLRDHVELRQLKRELRTRQRGEASEAQVSTLNPRRPARVLLADNDVTTRNLVSFFLEREGWEVHRFEDGASADDALARGSFDLALLELGLPQVSGFEVLRRQATRIAAREASGEAAEGTRNMVVFTSRNPEENLPLAFQLGAVDFIPKPFRPEELIGRVKRLLVTT
jgi:DNA-binding response OmpR family regulator